MTSFPRRALCRAALVQLVAQRGERCLDLRNVERERQHVVRAGADQRADERQRRLVDGRDQRRPALLGKQLEALDRARIVGGDLDDRRGNAGKARGIDLRIRIAWLNRQREARDALADQRTGAALAFGQEQLDRGRPAMLVPASAALVGIDYAHLRHLI